VIMELSINGVKVLNWQQGVGGQFRIDNPDFGLYLACYLTKEIVSEVYTPAPVQSNQPIELVTSNTNRRIILE